MINTSDTVIANQLQVQRRVHHRIQLLNMPPKTDIDAFIAACFRALKERPQVDWSRVAKETGMSDRGAQ